MPSTPGIRGSASRSAFNAVVRTSEPSKPLYFTFTDLNNIQSLCRDSALDRFGPDAVWPCVSLLLDDLI
jgi:hypothetical protein